MPTIADKLGRASIPTDVAIATTVKTTRVAGVNVLEAFDLSKYATDTPVFFVTYKKTTDPVTGIVSVTNLVSYKALVNAGANTLTNLTVAPGYVDLGNAVGDFIECIPTSYWENSLVDMLFVGLNPDGTFKKAQLQSDLGNDGRLVSTLDELTSDTALSGGVWSLLSGLNGQMTLFTAYIDGYKNTVAAIASRAFTVNKDTYVDVLRNTSTNAFSVVYTEVANGATTGFPLAANSIRIAKVITNGTTITSVVQNGLDSLGNFIYPSGAIAASNINLLSFEKIRVIQNANTTLTGPGVVIGFNTLSFVQGTKLTLSGTNVVIGAGVTKVKITTNLMADSASGAPPYLFGRIRINGTDMIQQLTPTGGGAFAAVSMSDIFPVKQGDLISVFADCGAGNLQMPPSRQSSLLVEVVG